jgi:hypothetical protein
MGVDFISPVESTTIDRSIYNKALKNELARNPTGSFVLDGRDQLMHSMGLQAIIALEVHDHQRF